MSEDIDPEDAPQIKDHKGPWDELVNRLILLAPWVVILSVGGYLLYTGTLTTDITLGGEIPVAPFAYLAGGLIGFTYLLAVMKFYGTHPVAWVAERIKNAAKDYNP